jgi:glycolate oxidase subunit GlcD
MATTTLAHALRARFGSAVLDGVPAHYLADETEGRGLRGRADAVALPADAEEVAALVAWCYEHDVAIVPRGGGTGFAGGAVPLDGGLVLSLERITRVRAFDPLLWRIEVEAGMPTAEVRRVARESGLYFPPDPGAAEQSQIGGNIATNAGGPHAFKYGVTGAWVTGLEAVVAPGELIRVGGPYRKDVAGYDLKSLLIGSEGTLGVVTAAWLRLTPFPEAAAPIVSFHDGTAAGCAALERVLGSGIPVSALEYLDAATVSIAGASFPGPVPEGSFLVLAEVDGSREEVARLSAEVADVLGENAVAVHAPASPAHVAALWRWRDGVSLSVQARRGGKASEDIVVPLDRLGEAIEETLAIGRRHDLPACSWGHAGDGNLHSTFLLAPEREDELPRAAAASEELFALAVRLGGSISGEHGVGWVKRGQLARQWAPQAIALHEAIKRVFDPKDLFNPGKKVAALG